MCITNIIAHYVGHSAKGNSSFCHSGVIFNFGSTAFEDAPKPKCIATAIIMPAYAVIAVIIKTLSGSPLTF